MSHSSVFVILESHDLSDHKWFENEVMRVLEPFDENKKVEIGEEECSCLEDEKPQHGCEECKGTGAYTFARNPKAKWDYHIIGGRWDGSLNKNNVKARNNPENHKPCDTCKGEKQVKVENEKSEKFGQMVDCFWCNGDGWRVDGAKLEKFWEKDSQNITTVDYVIEARASREPGKWDYSCFSILTPDGTWHERGRMGWFGCVSDEKDRELWENAVSERLEENRGKSLVIVDVHI